MAKGALKKAAAFAGARADGSKRQPPIVYVKKGKKK